MTKEEIKELQKLLEEHFELKELKDWYWRLEQIENWVDSKLKAQNQELLEKIDESLEGIQNMDRKMLSIKEVREIIKKLVK